MSDTTGWRPIEEAPRDGTKILGLSSDGEYGVCFWQKESVELWEQVDKDTKKRKVEDTGYWDGSEIFPVCWMPLPEPPEE